jgi:hypothetical protein
VERNLQSLNGRERKVQARSGGAYREREPSTMVETVTAITL